ncbi:putative B3 domain-containing protein Os03g0621600 [Triticum dicoccoides]|uniref:putative B3 domain-containing protein Os03g0621600 n=1 Tax=Triticum dicoccoides TaxID=85692 RepID=UPI0008437D1A|nr:putative B3 domain-containing protein Os03g0621600 [Triticum dicoccoides]XP_044410152.1 putative B3 domain-containing protein Os03g0621600 [Triticum aestivum]
MSGQMFTLAAAADVRYGVSMRREFGSHLENIAPETEFVKIIARGGLVFDFKVIRDDYEPFLSSGGWEEFVDATNIQEGDSVLFVYRGNFCLKAHIFNPSGHEKSFFFCQRPTEIFGDVPSSTLCDQCVMNGHEAHKANDRPSMNLEDGSPPLSNHVGGPSQHTYILARGATLYTQMKKRVEEKVQAIGSEIPIYVKKMTEISIIGSKGKGRGGRTYVVTFCREFASAWLPTQKTKIYLQVVGKTKPWRTKFDVGRRGDRMSWIHNGWEEFVWDNGLKVGDVCLFEAKKKNGQMLIVHMIRSEIEV